MKFIKMRIVNTKDFESVMIKLQMALGCLYDRKRKLVWIACFGIIDAEIIRDELEAVGSAYAGTWKPC